MFYQNRRQTSHFSEWKAFLFYLTSFGESYATRRSLKKCHRQKDSSNHQILHFQQDTEGKCQVINDNLKRKRNVVQTQKTTKKKLLSLAFLLLISRLTCMATYIKMTSAVCQPGYQSYCCHGDLDLTLCWLGNRGIARSGHLATPFVHPLSLQPAPLRKKSNLAWWSLSRLGAGTKEIFFSFFLSFSFVPCLLVPSALSHFIFRISTSPEKWITHHGKVSITFSDSKRIIGSFVCASLSELATTSPWESWRRPNLFAFSSPENKNKNQKNWETVTPQWHVPASCV